MVRTTGIVLIGALLLAAPAVAQTADGDAQLTYDQTHIEALFKAQDPSGQTLTREQIAAYRNDAGWGAAFRRMQADGYFAGYKNLGQVISGARLEAVGAYEARGFTTDKPNRVNRPDHVSRISRPDRPSRPGRR